MTRRVRSPGADSASLIQADSFPAAAPHRWRANQYPSRSGSSSDCTVVVCAEAIPLSHPGASSRRHDSRRGRVCRASSSKNTQRAPHGRSPRSFMPRRMWPCAPTLLIMRGRDSKVVTETGELERDAKTNRFEHRSLLRCAARDSRRLLAPIVGCMKPPDDLAKHEEVETWIREPGASEARIIK